MTFSGSIKKVLLLAGALSLSPSLAQASVIYHIIDHGRTDTPGDVLDVSVTLPDYITSATVIPISSFTVFANPFGVTEINFRLAVPFFGICLPVAPPCDFIDWSSLGEGGFYAFELGTFQTDGTFDTTNGNFSARLEISQDTAPVPGPVVGAGLPGLIFACGGFGGGRLV